MEHIQHKCEDPEKAERCTVCSGGLSCCTACGGGEAELPRDCPGRLMTEAERELVACGQLDFVVDRWVPGAVAIQNGLLGTHVRAFEEKLAEDSRDPEVEKVRHACRLMACHHPRKDFPAWVAAFRKLRMEVAVYLAPRGGLMELVGRVLGSIPGMPREDPLVQALRRAAWVLAQRAAGEPEIRLFMEALERLEDAEPAAGRAVPAGGQ